ncbi:hypothetical protein Q9966_005059 [Columba livia]|nr:hypothetical protein Q9966_005059 [Columba livia]
MGPLVFMDIFVQEICGRNPGTLFQQLLPALGSFLSHILLKVPGLEHPSWEQRGLGTERGKAGRFSRQDKEPGGSVDPEWHEMLLNFYWNRDAQKGLKMLQMDFIWLQEEVLMDKLNNCICLLQDILRLIAEGASMLENEGPNHGCIPLRCHGSAQHVQPPLEVTLWRQLLWLGRDPIVANSYLLVMEVLDLDLLVWSKPQRGLGLTNMSWSGRENREKWERFVVRSSSGQRQEELEDQKDQEKDQKQLPRP